MPELHDQVFPTPMRISTRAQRIEPFYVMEVAKAASKLARDVAHTERPMIFLNIGEPDFTAPPLVREAAERAIQSGATQYTQATGMPGLRERISGWYAERFKIDVPARRIVVTARASAALQLACLALIDAGAEILMPDPSYPCTRHIVRAAEGRAGLRRIVEVVRAKGGLTIIDEILLGLSYKEQDGHTALALGEVIISINSCS